MWIIIDGDRGYDTVVVDDREIRIDGAACNEELSGLHHSIMSWKNKSNNMIIFTHRDETWRDLLAERIDLLSEPCCCSRSG
jgi:hypothetical protein